MAELNNFKIQTETMFELLINTCILYTYYYPYSRPLLLHDWLHNPSVIESVLKIEVFKHKIIFRIQINVFTNIKINLYAHPYQMNSIGSHYLY